jgi:hypothetical protein
LEEICPKTIFYVAFNNLIIKYMGYTLMRAMMCLFVTVW